MNYEEPIHRIIGGIVHSPAFADKLPQQREFYNLTPPEYWELLHAHAKAVREHVKTLGDKAYWNAFADAPDFVIAFIPNESLLQRLWKLTRR
mgnify:CR=1 FL=1